ncbi:MAG: M20/M25/M40 family metallo-hydrolase [Actinobacteria bacterium]|nr:M20/M25/M40 family metallo-hydrolase [Actinomycetota bacterium]
MKVARFVSVGLALALTMSASGTGGGFSARDSGKTATARATSTNGSLSASTRFKTGPARTQETAAIGALSSKRVGGFHKWRAIKHVRFLAGRIGTRLRAHRGEKRGARYIARKFRRYGYEARIRTFRVDGRKSRNVVAWWRKSSRYPVVLGGHMDTVRGAPGANDNASGVAVLLETARIIAGKRPARWVRFVGFGSEEYGVNGKHHVGSQVFVNRLGATGRRRLAGMVSVDMIADGRPLRIGTAGIGPPVVARTAARRARKVNVGVSYRTACDCSDNGPFELAGIPASYMWSGPESNYHSPSDTVANMRPRDLARTGRAVRSFVRALDRRTIRRFRRH